MSLFSPVNRLRDDHEMLRQCPANGIKGNTPIQGDKTPALLDGERQQIGIGYMPRTQNPLPHQVSRLQQADGVSPECVRRVLGRFCKSLGHCCGGNRIGITRLRKDTDTSVLSDWARSPTFINMAGKPICYKIMMQVTAVKQRDQDVNVQQGTHYRPSASRRRLTASFVTTALPARKGRNPATV